MTYRLKLTRYEVQNINWEYYGVFRLRVEASDAEGEGLDANVFIYQRTIVDPYSSTVCDRFVAVAGPAQFAMYPAEEPNTEHGYPFYRLPYVELDFLAQSEAEKFWNTVKNEVDILIQGMQRAQELSAVEVVWFPSPPDESESVSV